MYESIKEYIDLKTKEIEMITNCYDKKNQIKYVIKGIIKTYLKEGIELNERNNNK